MIAVLGSVNLDFVATSHRLPQPGETIAGTAFATSPGGKGANQGLAARRAGSNVLVAGTVGNDSHGSVALSNLLEAGVDLSSIRKTSTPTGIASIFLGETDNMIISVPGANAEVAPSDADELIGKLTAGDWLLLQLEIPSETVRHALKEARRHGLNTVLNTAPFKGEAVELSKLADVIVMNETEMAEMSDALGERDVSVESLHDRLVGERTSTIVVTKGKEGAMAFDGRRTVSVKSLDIVPVDTVGAGDTFVGYLASGLSSGLPLDKALQTAAAAASLACTVCGAQPGIPLADEVARLSSF